MLTFISLIELTTLRYHVKLHQNLTSSFRVTGNFLKKKLQEYSQGQGQSFQQPKFPHF